MLDITSNGVSLALLEGQLLAGETDRSAFLERASPLGIGASEAAAVADKFLAIASNQAARQKNLKSRRVRKLDLPEIAPVRGGAPHQRYYGPQLENQYI